MSERQTKAGNQITLSLSHSLTLDILNNFCLHVYAQKSLFIAKNCNGFVFTTSPTSTSSPSPVSLEVIELVEDESPDDVMKIDVVVILTLNQS